MKKLHIAIIALVIFITLVGIIFLVIYKYNNKDDEKTIKEYKSIEVKSKDDLVSYGFIWIKDKVITNDLKVDDIIDFINLNKKKWETEELEYPVGDMSADGVLSDSINKTSIDKSDFIIAVYVQIDNEFSSKYSIHLVEK